MRTIVRLLFILTVLTLSLVLCGCDGGPKTDHTAATEDVPSTPESVMPGLADELGDEVSVIHNADGDVQSYTFSARLGESDYALYSIYFGEAQEGELYGYVSDEGLPVYILCYPLPEDGTLTELQTQRFYQLMDGINTVVDAINGIDRFTPA